MTSSLVFTVKRGEPELIAPAEPTPYEIKNLSVFDYQDLCRYLVPTIYFYRNIVGMETRDPAKVIKEAIAKALVYYYPFAGKIREGSNHTLVVECTGEGMLFIEADADVRLDQFGDVRPPFPGIRDLLCDVPTSGGVIDSPLLLIQVTRLMCGGFIVGCLLNHTMSDGVGIAQVMNAIADIARGLRVPSIQPIWKRELLNAREPRQVSGVPRIYTELPGSKGTPLFDGTDQVLIRSFFFCPHDIEVLKNHVPPQLRTCTRFEILAACLWRCRTISLCLKPDDEIRFACAVNARTIFYPRLPKGFYGNAAVLSVAQSTAGELCQNPLGYALQLVRKAKTDVTDEFMRSFADFWTEKAGPMAKLERTYCVSDVKSAGLEKIDFGWGKPLYGGLTPSILFPASFFVPQKNNKGVDGTVTTINLPGPSMEIFARELGKMLKEPTDTNPTFIL